MAEDEERNHSTFSKTKTIPGIQSAKEPAHLKCESALDAQQGILEQDSDSNLLMNLSLAESHIPSLGNLCLKLLNSCMFPKFSFQSKCYWVQHRNP